jgi:ribosomal protein S18 acetylase RimI-like enzyme
MPVRTFQPEDADAVATLSADCLRGETDFVLNPLWETSAELFAEFQRHAIDPTEHLLVAEAGDGQVAGVSGFLRRPGAGMAGLVAPIVSDQERGKGLGGELLRATLAHGADKLGIRFVVAGIGTRNRSGYSLLTALGFRPVRQHFLMRCDEPPASPVPPVDGLTFEPAATEDAAELLALYHTCGFEERAPEAMDAMLVDGRHFHAVARHDGNIVAFAEIETHWPRRVWVAFVGVDPGFRAKGVGSALVAWALRQRWDGGAESALLLLSPANRTAYRAYEKVGFRRHRTFDVLERALP